MPLICPVTRVQVKEKRGGIHLITLEICRRNSIGQTQHDTEAGLQEYSGLLEAVKQGEEAYAGNLGWLNPSRWAGETTLAEIGNLAQRVRQDAEVFVVVGVGGSLNAARAAIEALQTDGPEIKYMGNTLSPYALAKTLREIKGKKVYINCIAKNFETLEPGASFRLLRNLLEEQYGEHAAEHIIVTGTPGSRLQELCLEKNYTFLTFPEDVGGRYTSLTSVGLLPMAVAGIDIRVMAEGAGSMRETLLAQKAGDNVALRYAYERRLLYQEGYRMELLVCFEPQYEGFFKWWVQLFAESEGKENCGLFPSAAGYSEELHSLGQYVQEGTPILFETFLTVKEEYEFLPIPGSDIADGFSYLDGMTFHEINRAACAATHLAHSGKLPCLTLRVPRTDAHTFGGLFYFFQFACYLSGRLLGIDPFSQPGVEAYKESMFEALGKTVLQQTPKEETSQ